jgi:hypothetical protein
VTDDLSPLDPDVAVLLDEAKAVPELPAAAKASLFVGIGQRIDFVPGGGGGSGGDAGGPAAGGSAGGAASAGGLALQGSRAIVALATTFIVGVSAGVAVDRVLSPSAPPPAIATRASIASVPAPPVDVPGVPASALPSASPTVRVEPPPVRPASSLAPPPSARGLGAERALLDIARIELVRGEAGAALAAAERHRAEFPDGTLVEEREALAIKALVALGKKDEARTRAKELERRYPESLVLRAVKAAVDDGPAKDRDAP